VHDPARVDKARSQEWGLCSEPAAAACAHVHTHVHSEKNWFIQIDVDGHTPRVP
jgi:hypothetical protein